MAHRVLQRFIYLVAVTAASLLAQSGQISTSPEVELVIRSDTRLVVLHTTVQDKNNRPIADLPQSAFEVYEDGQLQTLKLFRREDVPVSLGILVDNSDAVAKALNSAGGLLNQTIADGDWVALVVSIP